MVKGMSCCFVHESQPLSNTVKLYTFVIISKQSTERGTYLVREDIWSSHPDNQVE